MSRVHVTIRYEHEAPKLPEVLTAEGDEALVLVRSPTTAMGWTVVDVEKPDALFSLLGAQLAKETLLVGAVHQLLIKLTYRQISTLAVHALAGATDCCKEFLEVLDPDHRAKLARSITILTKELENHVEKDEE